VKIFIDFEFGTQLTSGWTQVCKVVFYCDTMTCVFVSHWRCCASIYRTRRVKHRSRACLLRPIGEYPPMAVIFGLPLVLSGRRQHAHLFIKMNEFLHTISPIQSGKKLPQRCHIKSFTNIWQHSFHLTIYSTEPKPRHHPHHLLLTYRSLTYHALTYHALSYHAVIPWKCFIVVHGYFYTISQIFLFYFDELNWYQNSSIF
jgi:hypothetical protein